MNRSERRKLIKEGKVIRKDPVINIKKSDLDQIKKETLNTAIDIAFIMMLSIPVSIIHDKYSSIMKKEVDGKTREERFTELCLDLYDSYVKNYINISDLEKVLKEEAGVEIKKIWEEKKGLKIK